MVKIRLQVLGLALLATTLASCGGAGGGSKSVFRVLNLRIDHLVWVPQRDRLYASVSGFAGPNGNSVAVIDPVSQRVEAFIPVGSEPTIMAASDDGTTLYVGLSGAGAVRRVDLLTSTAGMQWSLGRSSFGFPFWAWDLDVMPGTTDTVAVACNDPNISVEAQLRVYDNGLMRSNVSAFGEWSGRCRFNSDGGRLYGFDTFTSGSTLYRYNVDAGGLSLDSQQPGAGPTFGFSMRFDAGKLFFSGGQVIDAETGKLLGTYPGMANGLLGISSTTNRVYGFSANDSLLCCQLDIYVLLATIPTGGGGGLPRGAVVAMGTHGVAFGTEGDQVWFIAEVP